MNIDFHYFATFFAAYCSGFKDEKKAKQIAWAAQMVDELTMEVAKKYKDKLGDNLVATVQSTDEMISEYTSYEVYCPNVHFLYDPNRPLQQTVRGIWVPFHFFPGHLSDEKFSAENIVPITSWEKNFFKQLDTLDKKYINACLRLRCAPNSTGIKEMLNYIKKQYHKYKDKNEEEALYAIGIGMHVLADTWSHDDFCGVPLYYTSKICYCHHENFKYKSTFGEGIYHIAADREYYKNIMDEVKYQIDREKVYYHKELRLNSIIFAGHGLAGYYPDYDFIKYYYYPRYSCPPNLSEIIKMNVDVEGIQIPDNPSKYKDAFLAMCNAISYILDKEKTDFNLLDTTNFGSKADYIKGKIFDIIPKKIPYIQETPEYYEGIVKDRCNQWKSYLERIEHLHPYEFKLLSGEIKQFAIKAKSYRDYALNWLERKMKEIFQDGPPFSFDISTIDQYLYHYCINDPIFYSLQ